MDNAQYRSNISYQALLLGAFAMLATALLAGGNFATKDAIAERQGEDLLNSLAQVIPSQMHDNNLLENPLQIQAEDGTPVKIYRATQDFQVKALAWEVSTQEGYAGEIRLIIGLNAKGEILGVRVLSHAETPGLGDKIEAAKNDWILGFNGLSLGNPNKEAWKVKKDGGHFDQFSGATITPRAVVGAVAKGLEFFRENRVALLSPPVHTEQELRDEQ